MSTRLNPYLAFQLTAKEAMEFYRSVFGGELTMSTYGESGMGGPDEAGKVMHAQLTTEQGLCLMGADTPNRMDYRAGTNYSVSLSGDDDAELRGYWKALSDGATILEPLEIAPWGDAFGMCIDRYGVSWMVNIAGAAHAQD